MNGKMLKLSNGGPMPLGYSSPYNPHDDDPLCSEMMMDYDDYGYEMDTFGSSPVAGSSGHASTTGATATTATAGSAALAKDKLTHVDFFNKFDDLMDNDDLH